MFGRGDDFGGLLELVNTFFLCLVPIFVALDPVGTLPNFLALTSGLEARQTSRALRLSLMTAWGVSVGFMLGGQLLLNYLGITVSDFMIAGGALLFVLSLKDLTSEPVTPKSDGVEVGAVPLGVPLLAGPGLLTTLLVLSGEYGVLLTGAALTVNIGLAGGLFVGRTPLLKLLGPAGSRIVGKMANLLLAAIAVMFLRKGLLGVKL